METKRGDQDHEVVANERQTTRWRQNEGIKTTRLKPITIQRKVETKKGDQDDNVVASVDPAYEEDTRQGDQDQKVLVQIRCADSERTKGNVNGVIAFISNFLLLVLLCFEVFQM